MSCIDCNNAQINKEREYYVRVGKANILVFGCQKHVGEMFNQLKFGARLQSYRGDKNDTKNS